MVVAAGAGLAVGAASVAAGAGPDAGVDDGVDDGGAVVAAAGADSLEVASSLFIRPVFSDFPCKTVRLIEVNIKTAAAP